MTALHDRLENLDADLKIRIETYMSKAERVDGILAVLTRSYCAACPRNAEYGCCDFAQEAVREMPAEAVWLQEAESLDNGGDAQRIEGICKYHSSNGCSLKLMKSSSCLGHLCAYLKAKLAAEHPANAEPFMAAMVRLVTGSLKSDPAALFEAMDEALMCGDKLLA